MAVKVTSATVSSQTTGVPVLVNWNANYPAIQVLVVAGVGTFNVEYTLDNINDPNGGFGVNGASATWQPVSTLSAKTTTSDATVNFPCFALRLNVTAYTSGNYIMKVLQGDSIG